jgi:hypothetical protein
VREVNRTDLIPKATLALDWATYTLSTRHAATGHEDFFAPLTAHAIPILKPYVPLPISSKWEQYIRNFNPYTTYRSKPGDNNWNVVALSGEMLYYALGLRNNTNFVEDSLGAQGEHFSSHFGLYMEGPIAYDHFPRLWVASILEIYSGIYAYELQEVMRRASLTSLFLQSPCGELPTGGRSAHHQWNEAEQIVTYEIFAARALAKGDVTLAGVFKRAAHLAFQSTLRWIRPTGELWIVKNYAPPGEFLGFERYSSNSQYNLLPMAMLAIAYEHASHTDSIKELATPADIGGYMLQIDLHKIVANVQGMYIEIDTNGDHHYDATGLVRVHKQGHNPQLGPSESLTEHAVYTVPDKSPRTTTGIGVSYQDRDMTWHSLGEFTNTTVSVNVDSETSELVSFKVSYVGDHTPTIIEQYRITSNRVELTSQVVGVTGALRYTWPVLESNGKDITNITVKDGVITVSLDGDSQTFTPVGAASISLGDTKYPNRNGWSRVAVAEYPNGGSITLVIEPK